MALAVDPAPFARDLAEYNSGKMAFKSHGRYFVTRVSVFAAILSDAILANFDDALLDHDRGLTAAQQAALDWQGADDGAALEDAEVLHNLMHISERLCPFERRASVVATVRAAQLDTPQRQGRSVFTSRSFSVRRSFMASYFNSSQVDSSWCHRSKCQPDDPWFWMWARCKLDSAKPVGVHWTLQLDYMDLDTPGGRFKHPTRRKRPRTPMVPMGLPFRDTAAAVIQAQIRRFKGVRYRHERKSWVAEMKPPTSKNKVSFGDFKSPLAAARAVDAAFFYFGKRQSLNFPDSALNLPPYLRCDGQLVEINYKAKLEFVKFQAKRLAGANSCFPEPSTIRAGNNIGAAYADAGAGGILPLDMAEMRSSVPTWTTQMATTFAGDERISGPQPGVQLILPSTEATAMMSSSFHGDAASRSLNLGAPDARPEAEFHYPFSTLQCYSSSLALAEHADHYMMSLLDNASYGLKELDSSQDEFWCSSLPNRY